MEIRVLDWLFHNDRVCNLLYFFLPRYPYLAVVLNFSQTWALYCLIQFYNFTKEKLEPIKPLAKFLVFKSIVFLTWWQGVILALLFSLGVFQGGFFVHELKTKIQDYIICIEVSNFRLKFTWVLRITKILAQNYPRIKFLNT